MVRGLKVEDNRHLALELIGNLLRIVEVARDDEMHLNVIATVFTADRSKRTAPATPAT